ncbi:hypothetical protein BYT27DRAFT_7255016 [Phlegmacium glaucopus]|nr:hypothetical protein BYT27DRAFT_7255016 [Phlegmacium glaucopus]
MSNIKKLVQTISSGNQPADRQPLDPVQSHNIYDNLEKEGIRAQTTDEVIKYMSQLTIQDPNYAVYYFCIMKLDPDIGKLIPPPSMGNLSFQLSYHHVHPSKSTIPTSSSDNPQQQDALLWML